VLELSRVVQQTNAGKLLETGARADREPGFQDYLHKAFAKLNDTLLDAEEASTRLATGDVENIHDVMIALKKADLSLQLAVNIRDKVVEAYQQVMRMQI